MSENNARKLRYRHVSAVFSKSGTYPKVRASEEANNALGENRRGHEAKVTLPAEAKLRNYAARLQDLTELLDLSHDSIIIHDLNGKIKFWNQGSERLYGWKRDEVLGKIMHKVLRTQFCEPLMKIIAAVSGSGKWEGELLHTSRDGETLTVESRWALRKSSQGRPVAILEIDRDITERKRQERMLKEMTEQLLLSDEEQRQQIATVLHDKLGQDLAVCKCDLNTLEKNTDGTMKQSLRHVIETMNGIIEEGRKLTMDLSSPTLHTFGLEAGVEELTERFKATHGIDCRFESSTEPKPMEKKIALLLYRSVGELLANASQHAKAEHVDVGVHRRNGSILITVRDDGNGFDTACLYENTLVEKGIGLYSISQRLKNIGGTFKIQSKIGKGTTVTLQAPLLGKGRQGDCTHDH